MALPRLYFSKLHHNLQDADAYILVQVDFVKMKQDRLVPNLGVGLLSSFIICDVLSNLEHEDDSFW